MKERYIALSVIVVTLVLIAGAMLIPGGRPSETLIDAPWLIEPTNDGSINVFKQTLGKSTLGETIQHFQSKPEISLFSRDGKLVVEAFFEKVAPAGLRGHMVIVMQTTEQQLQNMFDNGIRIIGTGGNEKKVTISEADTNWLKTMPIYSITFIPKASLDDDILNNRFGQPAEKIKEEAAELTHWLYPEKGLDILINEKGKAVMQYLPPRDFSSVTEPLKTQEKPSA